MDDVARRRAARAAWPIAHHKLGEDVPDLVTTGTLGERIAMVWQLTLDAWATAGLAIPDYPRSETPGRMIRRAP